MFDFKGVQSKLEQEEAEQKQLEIDLRAHAKVLHDAISEYIVLESWQVTQQLLAEKAVKLFTKRRGIMTITVTAPDKYRVDIDKTEPGDHSHTAPEALDRHDMMLEVVKFLRLPD
jgi:hypothetical protein